MGTLTFLELTKLRGLAGQWAPGVCFLLPLQCWNYKCTASCIAWVQDVELRSSCLQANTLSTELSPKRYCWDFKHCFFYIITLKVTVNYSHWLLPKGKNRTKGPASISIFWTALRNSLDSCFKIPWWKAEMKALVLFPVEYLIKLVCFKVDFNYLKNKTLTVK